MGLECNVNAAGGDGWVHVLHAYAQVVMAVLLHACHLMPLPACHPAAAVAALPLAGRSAAGQPEGPRSKLRVARAVPLG